MIKLSKSIFILLYFFSLIVTAEVIKEIEIRGLDTVSRGTVLNYLTFEVGDDINKLTLQNSINLLNKSNLFSDAKISVIDSKVVFDLKENPTIKYFEIKNYSDGDILNEEKVDEVIANYDLKPGSIFLKNQLDKLLADLKNVYSSNAYYLASFAIKTDVDDNNRIGIEISIDENDRALINSFSINGISNFEKDEIYDLFDMGEADFFLLNYFTNNDRFSKQELDAGIESVKNKYLNNGYLDVAIDSSNIKFDKEINKINILIIINEGDLFALDSIKFSVDKLAISENYLRSLFEIKDDEPFMRDKIVEGVNSIGKVLQNEGYAKVEVSSNAVILDDNKVKININITPNEEVYINRINISGNNRTQDDVIRRNFKINEGQIYSKKDIDESIKKIKRLGYFSNVTYELVPTEIDDQMNIDIEVIETKTGEFSVGLSHSNSTGASLNAGIQQTNIFGTGNTFNAAFSNSEAVDEVSFYFKNPYINDRGHSISYGAFEKSLDASNLSTSSYLIDETGLIFGYGVPLSSDSDIFNELRISSLDLTCGINLLTYENKTCTSNDDLETKISLTYKSDTLNDFFAPSSGHESIVVSTLALPIGDFEYLKLEASHRNYNKLSDSLTLKLSARTKIASSLGNDDLPFHKRFFEGGTSSVRGFDFNSLGSKYPDGQPKGGEFSLISSAGIISSVESLGIDNPNFKIFGFVDSGTLSEKFSDFEFNDLRASTGVGFNWFTPIGPMGFHYAKPIIKKDGDVLESFSFNLGAKF